MNTLKHLDFRRIFTKCILLPIIPKLISTVIQVSFKKKTLPITYRYMGMGKPITLQTIKTFFLKAVVINFPPSYFSPGAFGDKFPVGSVNLFKLSDFYKVGRYVKN